MQYFVVMQVLKSSENAGAEESSLLFCKFMFLADVVPKIASSHDIHDQVQILSILESLSHVYDELMLHSSQK